MLYTNNIMECIKIKNKSLNDICPICYEKSNKEIILPCGHKFNYTCIQQTFIDYFITNKKTQCPLCRTDIKKKILKQIFKKIYIPHIYPTEFINKNTVNLKNKILINKIEKIKIHNKLIYKIPCYKLENINIQHFFILDNIEFIYESFSCDIKNNFKLKLSCLLNRKNNNWKQFIKNNKLYKKLTKSINVNDDPNNSISLYIKNPTIIKIYNEKNGTIENGFKFYDQKSTILFRTYMVNSYNSYYFINELYSICYKN